MAALTKEQIEAKNQDPVDTDAVELPDNELEKAAGAIFSQPATFGHDYQSVQ